MARRTRKLRSRKVGLPPGSLVLVGEVKTDQPTIALFDYDAEGVAEWRFESIGDSRGFRPAHRNLWLNVHGLHDAEVMTEIGRRFSLHPLVLEDILNTDHRPKVEDYGEYLYIVARFFDYDPDAMSISSEQVSIVLGRNFVLTFQERPTGYFEPLRERLRGGTGQLRRMGADYLAYSLLDAVVDRYMLVIEQVGEQIERLEDEMLEHPSREALNRVHHLKRETQAMRRSVWPLREALNTMQRLESHFFAPETQLYLRDVHDHALHVLESLDSLRDLVGGLLEIYLSNISNRLNGEVRVLTVIATIFMPATLISGIFGMNFHFMPLLDYSHGFAAAVGMMVAVASTLGILFWRRKFFA